ncbi:hypothetical protein AAAX59_07760 [Collinsella sp. CLA-ER-H2]|uniref:hypothetical protein n=1 Tax=Collinsella sp. CLA-ER-H2 TaxID=3136220 RepID=UPI0032C1A7D7
MSGFKVVYRIDPTDDTPEITWEEGCPLLLDALQIARNTDTGEAYVQTRFLNISGEKINSFKVTITVIYGDGSEENLCLNPLDADIFSGMTYSARPVVLSAGDAIAARVKVEIVCRDSGQWVSHLPLSKVRKPCALSLSSTALEERVRELRELGCKDSRKASLYSIERNDGWTLCPCGQVNVGTKHCVSCGLDLSTYSSALEDLKTLSQKGADRKEREEAERQKRDEKQAETKKKAIRFFVPMLLIGLILLMVWYSAVFLPRDNAEKGLSAFEENNSLYEYDDWVDLDEWEEKSTNYTEELNNFTSFNYSRLSEESKLKVLKLLAKEETIDAIYDEVVSNWAIDPPELEVSLALDSVSIEDDDVKGGAFTVTVESRENAGWYSSSSKHKLSSSFECEYQATFEPDLEKGSVDMHPLQRVSCELM